MFLRYSAMFCSLPYARRGKSLRNTAGCYDRAVPAARIVAAVIALGACLALPVIAGAENPQATPRSFELRVAPGKPAVTAFTARLTGRFPVAIHGEGGSSHHHRALLHVEIHPR